MLRPTELGLTSVRRPLSKYKEMASNSLLRLLRIKGRQQKIAEVCLSILTTSPGSKVKVEGLYSADFAEINNHFGTIIGPILCYEASLVPGLKPHDHVYLTPYVSASYEFKVYQGDKPVAIRSQSRKIVLVPKYPGNIVRKIDMEHDLSKTYRETIPYQVIKTLEENNEIIGPVKAVSKYYSKLTGISPLEYSSIIREINRSRENITDPPQSLIDLISQYGEVDEEEGITQETIREVFETILVQQSQADPLYGSMYLDVSEANIMLLNFNLDRSGVWTINMSKETNLIDIESDRLRDPNEKLTLTQNGFKA